VQALLEDFFQKEMPAALRGPIPARRQRPVSPARSALPRRAAKPRANSLAGYCMVGFTSVLMLMLAFLAWDNTGLPPEGSATNTQLSPLPEDNADLGHRETPGEPGDFRLDGKGPIETRPRTRTVGTEELFPNGGEHPPFPELDIEVYPLDRESPAEAEPSESRRQDAPSTPMPEESRQLPENSPSDPFDPDEAALEPLLPELRGF
jgi:hypothetical protein